MPEGASTTTLDTSGQGTQLSTLIPTFDPATDNVEQWAQKIELLTHVWPEGKLNELATRIILSTKGSAFGKLQLRQKELLVGTKEGIEKIVQIVGGQFGRVNLEQKFDLVEKALFRCVQKPDETSDSFLARCEVVWTELHQKKVKLEEVQAFIILRGSRLGSEDKKRVLVESGVETPGSELEMSKVAAAIRMLGSSFFQEFTAGKKEKSMRTYDHHAFGAEEVEEVGEEGPWEEDQLDEEALETLAAFDEDASLVLQFEGTLLDTIQEDQDLSAFYVSYQDARRRLLEKSKSRGFWPIKGNKGSRKGKGKGFKGRSKGLAHRIANSACRLCGQTGHWKAECPQKKTGASGSESGQVPTSVVIDLETSLFDIPEANSEPLNSCQKCFVSFGIPSPCFREKMKTRLMCIPALRKKLAQPTILVPQREPVKPSPPIAEWSADSEVSCFASTGTVGVVDLGASQTVIGSQQVPELLENLPEHIRKQVKKTKCNLTFRFGNHQTLSSSVALIFPVHTTWFRVAIVPGKTPFLLSNAFLRTLQAVIDTEQGTLWSRYLGSFLETTKSSSGLMLLDLNQLWTHEAALCQDRVPEQGSDLTHSTNRENITDEPKQLPTVSQSFSQTESSNRQSQGCVRKLINQFEQKKIHVLPGQLSVRPQTRKPPPCKPSDHVLLEPEAERVHPGGEEGGREGRNPENRANDSASAPRAQDLIRQSKAGTVVRTGIPGSILDEVVHPDVRNKPQAGASKVHSIRHVEAGRINALCPESSPGPQQAGESPLEPFCARDRKPSSRDLGGNGRSMGDCGERSHHEAVRPPARDGPTTESHRKCIDGHPQAPRGSDVSALGRSADLGPSQARTTVSSEIEHMCNLSELSQKSHQEAFAFDFQKDHEQTYNRLCQYWTQKFRSEVQKVLKVVKPKQQRSFLFEVMCSKESELTRQSLQQGLTTKRFGYAEGDLSTEIGRRNLFCHLVRDNPKHVWISPTCGPWCRWSTLNMSKSDELCSAILQKRKDHVWQIALAIVLCEYQVQHDQHFHCEQPSGSHMLNMPCFLPILQMTKPCTFDLCRVGDLRLPSTGIPIRKRLCVCTTSESLQVALNNRHCRRDHEHHHIAGSTKVEGESIPVSSFTELYPRKFARQIVQSLRKEGLGPWDTYAEEEEHPTKRRRLDHKSRPSEIRLLTEDPSWDDIMKVADETAPRVGIRVLSDGPLVQAIQRKHPNHHINHLVLCRGMDRMVGPHVRLEQGQAPLRKFVCIRRRFESVEAEDQWEAWERFSARQMRRPCTPARCGLTIFARALQSEETPASDSQKRKDHPDDHMEEEPKSKASRNLDLDKTESEPKDQISERQLREVVDMVSEKHGPKMLALNPEERSWILKIHKNMGHPGVEKLKLFCQQMGCEEHVIKAIEDLRCSTCLELKGPDIAKPSAIHEQVDFGDLISMDGIKWTNKTGKQFFFYHFVDQSTTFHVAHASISHGTQDAIHALMHGWIKWAGPPGTLLVDAGSEFCTESFHAFLQEHDIKLRMIAPEAHWQNSRVERHGGILQHMLDKMDHEKSINTGEELEVALHFATQTKNKWSRHRGFPPEVLVFGKMSKCPASISSEPSQASHLKALQETSEGIRFREHLAARERARKAFSEVDNSQALRRALVQRSRPQRTVYHPGDWIMAWRKDSQWFGPLKVVLQEDKNVIWAVLGNRLFRIAPEHARPLSAMEELRHQSIIRDTNLDKTLESIRAGNTRFEEIPRGTPEGLPGNPEAPSSRTSELPTNEQPDQEPDLPEENDPSFPGTENEYTPTVPDEETQNEAPENIPVPEDDELWCETFHLQEDEMWRFEVEISREDIDQFRNSPSGFEHAFIVSAAKKQKTEVKLSNLTKEERQLFEEAKGKEIQSWLDTKTVCKIFRHQIPTENILRCRWILTWKDAETNSHLGADTKQSSSRKAKARLVILGYQDPSLEHLDRDSPTLSKLSRNLLLQMSVSMRWTIGSFDVKTAFLRGSVDDTRVIGLEPPEELRQKLGLRPNEVCRLLKGAYGLVNAPLLWYKELSRALEELGFTVSPFDPCCFILYAEDNSPQGFIGIHVDDGLFAGNEEFHRRINLLESKYPFGSRKEKDFVFTGLHVHQKEDFSIRVDQTQYVKDINHINIPKERRSMPDDPITEDERQKLRGIIGSLQYASVNTRPDLGSRLSHLQSRINCGQVKDLIESNKLLHDAKVHSQVAIRYQYIPLKDIRFVAFSDASFASEKNLSAHQGMMIMTAHQNIGKNHKSAVNPIIWSSKKIQKVAVSTLSAEAMALAGTVDLLAWCRLYWGWLLDRSCQWRLGDKTLLKLPPAFSALKEEGDLEDPNSTMTDNLQKLQKIGKPDSLIATDCKSLYDLISRTAPPACQEYRTLLQARLIREHLATGVSVRWVPSNAQIADSLTKVMDNTNLREVLNIGRYQLKDEDELLKHRSDRRSRLAWIRSHQSQQAAPGLAKVSEKGKSQDVPDRDPSCSPI